MLNTAPELERDDRGNPAPFQPGDRVEMLQKPWCGMMATIERQILHYDSGETFWGDLILVYDDGVKGRSHSWQVKKLSSVNFPEEDK